MWLELNKNTKRAQFTRGEGRIEIPAVLEGQGKITQLAAKLPPGRVWSKPQESVTCWLLHTDRQLLHCSIQGQTRGLSLLLLGKLFVSYGLPEGVMSGKTPQFVSKEFVANIKLNCWHIGPCNRQVSKQQQDENLSDGNKDRFFLIICFFIEERPWTWIFKLRWNVSRIPAQEKAWCSCLLTLLLLIRVVTTNI